jgi:HK97 family phage portal protein
VTLFGDVFQRRNLENPTRPLTDSSLVELLGGAPGTTGVTVTERNALRMAAVWRCVKLTSAVPSALPLHIYQRSDRTRATSTLMDDPHPEMPALELWRLSYVHRALWGNSYQQKIRNGAGQVVELWPITPDRVQVERVRVPGQPPTKVFTVTDDWGVVHDLTSRDILHIPGMGYDGVTGVSPIRAANEAIGMGLAAERYGGKLFGSGSLMSGILQTEQRLDKDAADALKERWKAKVSGLSNAHDIAVLDSGASFQSVTMPNKDSQFIESRRFQVVEAARFFGVPLVFLFETEKSTSWGTGLEQQALGWIQFDMHPDLLAPTEARLTKELLKPAGLFAEYSVEGILRGDTTSRSQFYRVMREVGAYSANDIRKLENRPPIPEGDSYLQPVNLAPLGSDPTRQDPAPPDDDDDGNDE